MEDHLLEIFGGHDTQSIHAGSLTNQASLKWSNEALQELSKIPGFVRGRVRKNTEKFAEEKGLKEVTVSVMYKAKEANKL